MHIPPKPALLRRFGHKYASFPARNIQFVRGTKRTVPFVPLLHAFCIFAHQMKKG